MRGCLTTEPARLIRQIAGFYVDETGKSGKQSGVRSGAIKPISIY
jgi:hypothetical protein